MYEAFFEYVCPSVKLIYSYDCQHTWLEVEFETGKILFKYNFDDER